MAARLELTRAQVLAFRRRVGALEERLPPRPRSLRTAAWAGLQDSAGRAPPCSRSTPASRALHPEIWDDDAFVQVWGAALGHLRRAWQRGSRDLHGRSSPRRALPRGRARAEDLAGRLGRAFLAGRTAVDNDVHRGIGVHNALRYAATTGRVLIRWEGARAPLVWTVPRPAIAPLDARRELARRYLHVFGPGTSASFAKWAGVTAKEGTAAFDGLERVPVRTPLGDEWILASDESLLREPVVRPTAVRLLPSGDAYWLFYDAARRAFLVPDLREREALWTPRVWPGALLVAGELAGTWRRQRTEVLLEPWRSLTAAERDAVDTEIASLPLRAV